MMFCPTDATTSEKRRGAMPVPSNEVERHAGMSHNELRRLMSERPHEGAIHAIQIARKITKSTPTGNEVTRRFDAGEVVWASDDVLVPVR